MEEAARISVAKCRASLIESRRRKAKILEEEEHWLDVLGAAESRTWKERYSRGVKVQETERTTQQELQEVTAKSDTTRKVLETERAQHQTTQQELLEVTTKSDITRKVLETERAQHQTT